MEGTRMFDIGAMCNDTSKGCGERLIDAKPSRGKCEMKGWWRGGGMGVYCMRCCSSSMSCQCCLLASSRASFRSLVSRL